MLTRSKTSSRAYLSHSVSISDLNQHFRALCTFIHIGESFLKLWGDRRATVGRPSLESNPQPPLHPIQLLQHFSHGSAVTALLRPSPAPLSRS